MIQADKTKNKQIHTQTHTHNIIYQINDIGSCRRRNTRIAYYDKVPFTGQPSVFIQRKYAVYNIVPYSMQLGKPRDTSYLLYIIVIEYDFKCAMCDN